MRDYEAARHYYLANGEPSKVGFSDFVFFLACLFVLGLVGLVFQFLGDVFSWVREQGLIAFKWPALTVLVLLTSELMHLFRKKGFGWAIGVFEIGVGLLAMITVIHKIENGGEISDSYEVAIHIVAISVALISVIQGRALIYVETAVAKKSDNR